MEIVDADQRSSTHSISHKTQRSLTEDRDLELPTSAPRDLWPEDGDVDIAPKAPRDRVGRLEIAKWREKSVEILLLCE